MSTTESHALRYPKGKQNQWLIGEWLQAGSCFAYRLAHHASSRPMALVLLVSLFYLF